MVFRSTMGGEEGDSKTERGGFVAVGRNPREFLVRTNHFWMALSIFTRSSKSITISA